MHKEIYYKELTLVIMDAEEVPRPVVGKVGTQKSQ